MKRCFSYLFAVAILLGVPGWVSAAEVIKKYDVSANLEVSRLVTVKEEITYDFGSADKHGIFRDIPMVYRRDGGNYSYRYDVVRVLRDGKAEPYTTSYADGNMSLKIGDKEKTVSGAHVYTIEYKTDRAINDFDTSQEFYWNAVGDGWQVPIESVAFTATGGPGVDMGAVSSTCFVGAYGSTEKSCGIKTQGGGIVVTAQRVLEAREGLTVAIAFPKGTFQPISLTTRIWQFIQDNGVLLLPVVVFLFLFFRWWTKGRDPRMAAVIPEYEAPEGYTPALMAAAATEGDVPDRSITATIIDLAQRGYMHIRFSEEKGLLFGTTQKYTFVKTQKQADGLSGADKIVYDGIFKQGDEVPLDALKEASAKFYSVVADFKRDIQKNVDAQKLFDKNPGAVRGAYIALGFLVAWGTLFFFARTGLSIVVGIVTGILIAVFGWIMPRRTAEGMEVLRKVKGFEWFMSVTEKGRLDFHNAPERTPSQFMAILPFAIAAGLEKKWAAQFTSLNIPAPSWAEGTALSHFSAANFVSSLGDMHTSAAGSFSPPSSAGSGGSGFSGGGSGGGGGGGGGGSW